MKANQKNGVFASGFIKIFLGMLSVFIFYSSHVSASENYIWLKQGEVKYDTDGSAFCEVTLMQGEEYLQIEAGDILRAQCVYRFRRESGPRDRPSGPPSEKHINLPAHNFDGKTVFKVSSAVGSSCNVLVNLTYKGEYYTAQSDFSIFADGWNKDNFRNQIDSNDDMKILFPSITTGNIFHRFPLTGQKLTFKYNTAAGTNKNAGNGEVEVIIDGSKIAKKLQMNDTGTFSYIADQAPPLTISLETRFSTTFIAKEEYGGKLFTTTLNINIFEPRYYNTKRGVILFFIVGIIIVIAILYHRRRHFINAYK
ncbi:MAG: hypothetical protein LBT79_02510 [Elusimicrobiota bacterium]|jgi:hypothetical protein|nr:hypothetical protein [Elusimicrobiota bacterium]